MRTNLLDANTARQRGAGGGRVRAALPPIAREDLLCQQLVLLAHPPYIQIVSGEQTATTPADGALLPECSPLPSLMMRSNSVATLDILTIDAARYQGQMRLLLCKRRLGWGEPKMKGSRDAPFRECGWREELTVTRYSAKGNQRSRYREAKGGNAKWRGEE